MIDEVDRSLTEWVVSVLGDPEEVAVDLRPPGAPDEGVDKGSVGLYLLDLLAGPAARESGPQPLQFKLRYLVTVSSQRPEEAHRRLGQLAFAALARTDFEVELGGLPAVLWQSFGVPPRPAFQLLVPVRRERPARPVARVRVPLVVETSPLSALAGIVLGPGDVPIAGAWVELPALHLSTHTDTYGRFELAPVPAEGAAGTLRIRAKGREITIAATSQAGPEAPLTIRFQAMED